MKRILVICFLLVGVISAQATITINLGASMIYNADGTTPEAEGMLVQLIASTTDNIFSSPTTGSFTGNSSDDLILGSFFVNSGPGTVAQPLILTFSGNFNAGDLLLLRWFPTISGTTIPAAPPAGSAYGQFRTDIVENFSNTTWVAPADGSTVDLNFLTTSGGGTEPNSTGRASLTVTAIPEPSTYALFGFASVGLMAFARRRTS